MIISFSLENWMSFRDKATFSMVASREQQHGHRIAKLEQYSTRVLPVAAVYGGNASGKSNFFKALDFLKRLVVRGTLPGRLIPVKPFVLGPKGDERPSRFCLELLVDKIIYEFSLTITSKKVMNEKLVAIDKKREKVLYERCCGEAKFHPSLAKKQFLNFAFQGTRDNQLFLTNSVNQNIDFFRHIYDWFDDKLFLVTPNSRFEPFEHLLEKGSPFHSDINEKLRQLDTGIENLDSEEVQFESIPLPEELRSELEEVVTEDSPVRLSSEMGKERFMLSRKDGEMVAKKIVTFHSNSEGSKTRFELAQESDGSQRVIELLPAFLDLSTQTSQTFDLVYVIDELDRSLHTLLVRKLLEMYLESCSSPDKRTQLLFTTHDVLLMDQELLRRDEMWVTERDAAGNSSLIALSEYKDIRKDKDIRKSYLEGRFGGIPMIVSEAH